MNDDEHRRGFIGFTLLFDIVNGQRLELEERREDLGLTAIATHEEVIRILARNLQ